MNAVEREDDHTLGVLSAVSEEGNLSQRRLALHLGVALGLANSYLKRCVKKGWVKVHQVPGNRYLYYLTPRGFAPDGEVEENCFRTIHAEINAIAQAAKHGVSIGDSSIYITHSPCIHCLKVIVNTGIKRVCFEKPYKLHNIEAMVERSGLELIQVGEVPVS